MSADGSAKGGWNQGQRASLRVLRGEAGLDLASWLALHKIQWERWDSITVNGQQVPQNSLLHNADLVEAWRAPWCEPAVPELRILHREPGLLVIDKPHGQPVTPTHLYLEHCTLHQVRRHMAAHHYQPLHRLDADAAGCVAFSEAGTPGAPWRRAFQQGCCSKDYRALVLGRGPDPGLVELALRRRTSHGIHAFHAPSADGKTACSEILSTRDLGPFSLVELRLHTGRTHQARVHLAALGCPILGDKKYLDPDQFLPWLAQPTTRAAWRRFGLPFLALQASRQLWQRGDGTRLEIKAEEPLQHWLRYAREPKQPTRQAP
jgi:23S rRNA pseudouridine1911/1915/1917 synthase